MFFILILSAITLAIAGAAAFFSIYGLAAIFSGIFWPVVLMGTSLEAGKLATVSYMYRFKDSISVGMKVYLGFAVFVLMFITSAGIFGYLSMGYQQDTIGLKQGQQQIELLNAEQIELQTYKAERIARKKQIDADIASLPNNFITGRQRLMKSYGDELLQLRNDIELYTTQLRAASLKISELKQEKLITEIHTGPIIFIAQALEKDTDDAVKWMIILIMFAFDPLAVALTLAVNNAIMIRKAQLLPDDAPDPAPEPIREVKAEVVQPAIVVKAPIEKSLDVATMEGLIQELLGKHDLTEQEKQHRDKLLALLNKN